MHIKSKGVRVIHWDPPVGVGLISLMPQIAVKLDFIGITDDDRLVFSIEERYRLFWSRTGKQAGSWIAEQTIQVKFDKDPKVAMVKTMDLVDLAHDHFNNEYLNTVADTDFRDVDMLAPSDENKVIMVEKIVAVAKQEHLIGVRRKRKL